MLDRQIHNCSTQHPKKLQCRKSLRLCEELCRTSYLFEFIVRSPYLLQSFWLSLTILQVGLNLLYHLISFGLRFLLCWTGTRQSQPVLTFVQSIYLFKEYLYCLCCEILYFITTFLNLYQFFKFLIFPLQLYSGAILEVCG